MSVQRFSIEHMSENLTLAADASPLPTERLEAEICALAGHLAAATCRFIDLIADYDERQAWAQWEMRSCAEWLSWKCSLAPGTAREHVRVGRALRTLPVIHREFAAGRMSYSKVRELTRIATPDTDADLAEMTTPMTASQVERFARAHHRCNQDQRPSEPRRALRWRTDPDNGEMSISIQLPPADGAVVLQALRAAIGDLDHPHEITADQRPDEFKVATENLADALLEVAGSYLRGKIAAADNADIYQVIVHSTADALGADVPAGTSRCHLEDGPAIDPVDAQRIACDATVSTMTHGADGTVLNVGRRTRKVPPAIRRAVRERDGARCVFPGCNSRRVDQHHIQWWSRGGETSADNLMNLCRAHHRLVHAKAYVIARRPAGAYAFTDPASGTTLAPVGHLPAAEGPIGATHSATITAATIQQASGERLDLHYAIWVALLNARNPRTSSREFYNIPHPVAALRGARPSATMANSRACAPASRRAETAARDAPASRA
jgi:hypothetical protein